MKARKQNRPGAVRRVATLAAAMLLVGAIGCTGPSPVITRDDPSISEAVRTRLASDVQTKPYDITVGTTEGVVRVSGSVAKSADRDAVERIARETPGVRSVDNHVRFGNMPVPVGATTP